MEFLEIEQSSSTRDLQYVNGSYGPGEGARLTVPLMQRFDEESSQLTAVHIHPLVPDFVVCTTTSGFVQLMDLAAGSYRVFLTHHDKVPLDAKLRCASLAPSLFRAAGGALERVRRSIHAPQYFLYSLSFSNELLAASFDTGETTLIETFGGRPSALATDGSYVAVGDGRGRVKLYRGDTLLEGPSSATSTLFSCQVSMFGIEALALTHHGQYVVAAAQDYKLVVLSTAAAGTAAAPLTTLMGESSMVSLLRPVGNGNGIAVVFDSGSHIVFQPATATGDEWTVASFTTLEVPAGAHASTKHAMVCMTSDATHVVVGTADGTVILFEGREEEGGHGWRELRRLEVSHAVIAVQLLAPSEVLVVVTASGDVWRWSKAELLAPEGEQQTRGANEDDDEQALLHPSTDVPVPQPERHELHDHVVSEASQEDHNNHYEEEDDVQVVDMDTDAEADPVPSSSRHAAATTNAVVYHSPDDMASTADADSVVPSSVAFTNAANTTAQEEMLLARVRPQTIVQIVEPQRSPQAPTAVLSPVRRGSSAEEHLRTPSSSSRRPNRPDGAAAATSPSSSQLNNNKNNHSSAYRSTGHPHQAHTREEEEEQGEPRLGTAGVAGLLEGRRMDPRAARELADRKAVHFDPSLTPLGHPEAQSSLAVQAMREQLSQTPFDAEAYAATKGKLQVEAYRFQHPIHAVSYAPDEIAFRSVGLTQPLITEHHGSAGQQEIQQENRSENAQLAGGSKKQRGSSPIRMLDDLVDATLEKYGAKIASTRRQQKELNPTAAPSIQRHWCMEVLSATPLSAPAAIFFEEMPMPVETDSLLMLPMPNPPSAMAF